MEIKEAAESAESADEVKVPELGYERIAPGLADGLPAVLANVTEGSDMRIKETLEAKISIFKIQKMMTFWKFLPLVWLMGCQFFLLTILYVLLLCKNLLQKPLYNFHVKALEMI